MTTHRDTAVDAGRHHPPTVPADPTHLAARILTQLRGDGRFILGLTGPPGTGKSTVVAAIAGALHPHPVVVIPMDGFHLANTVIRGTPRQTRKGAIDTFDAAGYAVLLRRLHQRDEDIVYAPSYCPAPEFRSLCGRL